MVKKECIQEVDQDVSFASTNAKSNTVGQISMVENNDSQVAKFYDKIYKYSNEPVRIGVTGPPGAGKSTLVDKLISCFIFFIRKFELSLVP